jgi:hypothetical protein
MTKTSILIKKEKSVLGLFTQNFMQGLSKCQVFFNILQVASSALGIGPQTAMHLAERLYTQGFIRFHKWTYKQC